MTQKVAVEEPLTNGQVATAETVYRDELRGTFARKQTHCAIDMHNKSMCSQCAVSQCAGRQCGVSVQSASVQAASVQSVSVQTASMQ